MQILDMKGTCKNVVKSRTWTVAAELERFWSRCDATSGTNCGIRAHIFSRATPFGRSCEFVNMHMIVEATQILPRLAARHGELC